MKKVLAIVLCLVTVCAVFAACKGKDTGDASTTYAVKKVSEVTTDTAKITNADAIHLIQSYSSEELGITDEERKGCKFLVNTNGVEVDGDYYIQVTVSVEQQKVNDDGSTVSTFDHKAICYIRYDGKKVLRRDMKTGKNIELKVKEVPTTEKTDAHAEESTTTTTKK